MDAARAVSRKAPSLAMATMSMNGYRAPVLESSKLSAIPGFGKSMQFADTTSAAHPDNATMVIKAAVEHGWTLIMGIPNPPLLAP